MPREWQRAFLMLRAKTSAKLFSFFAALVTIFSLITSPLQTLSASAQEVVVTNSKIENAVQQASQPTIVGGGDADEGEYPWMVLLSNGCGGSLIHPNWVVTAAHCLRGRTDIDLTFGEHDRYTLSDHEQYRSSSNFKLHEMYNDATSENDVALIYVSPAVELTQYVQPIRLVAAGSHLETVGTITWAAGWGVLNEGDWNRPAILQKVDLPVVEQAACSAAYPGSIKNTNICAGYPEGGKDTCQGDSGGPLMARDEDQMWYLVGITSFGRGCARENAYGVYVRVSAYLDWIEANSALSAQFSPDSTQVAESARSQVITTTLQLSNTSSLTLTTAMTLTSSGLSLLSSDLFKNGTSSVISVTTAAAGEVIYTWQGEVPPGMLTDQLQFVLLGDVAHLSIQVGEGIVEEAKIQVIRQIFLPMVQR